VAQNSYNTDEKSSLTKEDDKILEEGQARFNLADEAESDNRELELDDIEFLAGNHWPEKIKAEREADGRPCLVINKLPQSVQQVTNDQRQNRPSIKVHPVDDGADIETAKVIQGLIRHIEYNSNAEVAYDTAFSCAATSGLGYFRIITDYVDSKSFEQEILIKSIKNRFSVFFDPFSKEPDGSDANWAHIIEDLSEEEYKSKYPNSKLASRDEWESVGNSKPSWMPSGSARVAEYFYKELKKETLVLLNTGEVFLKSELPKELLEGVFVEKERETVIPKICWAKINACEVLEKTEWPGKYIPIIPVYGSEIDINGVRILSGIVRNAKDPARMYDYWASAETEAIALAPKAPFIVAEGQLEGYEAIWATANRKNNSFLPYKPTSINGTLIGAPQRSSSDVSTQAITQARMLASEDIKATTGIYDATLGSKSNETSGVAIQRRNMQAQTSNFHFVDNLTRSLRHAGRILIDLIPKIYDTSRTARIIAEDGEQRVVRINDPSFEENGKQALYALDVGKYDVTVDVGPSFQTKRQEAAASMLELSKAAPQMMQVAPDLIVKNMDFPGAQELAERFRKTLPPNLVDDPKNQNKEIPPQVQAQMQQMNQMVEQLTGKLNELQTEKDQKLIEIESKERIEMAKLENQATIELAKLESNEALKLLAHQIAELDQRTQILGMNQPFPGDQNFESQSDGEFIAESEMESQPQPTGGFSPGQPMEGNIP